ncbi:uncharacterized protein LOC135119406 isoform X2 [Zophobas morio]|jgi:hypothetical protein|uniref:uncharacterized protein LOC135119406 isoform X2 n=1 Tax=Zophobas morio TaxID=2755281 RepID=UPI00308378F4
MSYNPYAALAENSSVLKAPSPVVSAKHNTASKVSPALKQQASAVEKTKPVTRANFRSARNIAPQNHSTLERPGERKKPVNNKFQKGPSTFRHNKNTDRFANNIPLPNELNDATKPSGRLSPEQLDKTSGDVIGDLTEEALRSKELNRRPYRPRNRGVEVKERHSRGGPGTGMKEYAKRGGARRGDWGRNDDPALQQGDSLSQPDATPNVPSLPRGLPERPAEAEGQTLTLAEYKAKLASRKVAKGAPGVGELNPDTEPQALQGSPQSQADASSYTKQRKERLRRDPKRENVEASFSVRPESKGTQGRRPRGPRPHRRELNTNRVVSKSPEAPDVECSVAFPTL